MNTASVQTALRTCAALHLAADNNLRRWGTRHQRWPRRPEATLRIHAAPTDPNLGNGAGRGVETGVPLDDSSKRCRKLLAHFPPAKFPWERRQAPKMTPKRFLRSRPEVAPGTKSWPNSMNVG